MRGSQFPHLTSLVSGLPGMAYRCLHDENWTLEFASDGCLDLLGYSAEQLVSERVVSMSELIHPDDLEHVSLTVEKALATRSSFSLEYRMKTANGQLKWVAEIGRGQFDPDGNLIALQGFLADITERVAAEDALREIQKLDAISALAGGLAHDLKNLFFVITNAAKDLRKLAALSEEQSDSVGDIENASALAGQLLDQLLELGSHREASTIIDLNEHIAAMTPLIQRLIGEGIELHLDLTADATPVLMDPSSLEQILCNLVVNACHAMPDGGRLTVHTCTVAADLGTHRRRREGWTGDVRLEVSDQGTGIQEHLLERVFEPLFTTKAPGVGTGLGLSVVNSNVKRAGGIIEVDSKTGRGTRVSVSLPRVTSEADGALASLTPLLLVGEQTPDLTAVATELRGRGLDVFTAVTRQQAQRIAERHKGELNALVTWSECDAPDLSGLVHAVRERFPDVCAVLVAQSDLARARLAAEYHAIIGPPAGIEEILLQLQATQGHLSTRPENPAASDCAG